jgi:hypothetical protein
MRRLLPVACAAVLLAAAAAAAPAAPTARPADVQVSVSPGAGGPATRFAVALRLPLATGTFQSARRIDTVDVAGPQGAWCDWTDAVALPSAARGSLVTATLAPRAGVRGWCAGSFHGTIESHVTIVCGGPTRACPMIEVVPQVIGTFRFRVREGERLH